MNRFDEFAVEEALQVKSRFPATRVDAVSLGPQRAGLTLKRAMGMGADCAIHLLMPDTGNCSPLTVARAISAYARGKDYGLILTGVMAEDDMQGQVGPLLGELLDMPCATSVIAQRLDLDAGSIYAEREMAGMNRPRYPSLSQVLRSKEVDVETIDVHALSLPESGEWVEKVEYPQRSRACNTLEGTPQEKVHRLVEILKKKSFI
jgi:electron transfer flavoprotein beta subunit